MRSKEFEGWVEAHECWRQAQVKFDSRSVGIAFTRVEELYRNWWQSVRNPHGWDITIKARGLKK